MNEKFPATQNVNTKSEEFFSTLKTKNMQESNTVYDTMVAVTSIPPILKMDYSRILNKPYLINTVSWNTTGTINTELSRISIPSALYTNYLASVPFKSSALYQTRLCLMLQVSGTPMHQGMLLAAAVPCGVPTISNINAILGCPHVFMSANEATSVCLEIPFFSEATLMRTVAGTPGYPENDQAGDYAQLIIFIKNPLNASSGSSTTLSVSIHAEFKEMDFYIPKVGEISFQPECLTECFKSDVKLPSKCECSCVVCDKRKYSFEPEGLFDWFGVIHKIPSRLLDAAANGTKAILGDIVDMGRAGIRLYTGFHNPNSTEIHERMIVTTRNFPNNIDQPTLIEKLDPYTQQDRIYNDYYFRTKIDEMDVKYLLQKPVYVGTFSVVSTDPVGKSLMSYPITPMVEAKTGTPPAVYYSNMRTIYEMSRFWRGSLKMHIQAVMTNFHYCKIIFAKNYAIAAAQGASNVPSYNDIHNMLTDTLEFSAGGQIQTIDLPFCSPTDQIECTKDYTMNAFCHGVVYGYLVQPLTFNSNVPLTVNFNVYFSAGDDLEFYGYAVDNMQLTAAPRLVFANTPEEQNSTSDYSATELKSKLPPGEIATGIEEIVKDVIFKPEADVTVGVSSQDEVLNVDEDSVVHPFTRQFRPIVNVRDYLRRFHQLSTKTITPTEVNRGVYTISIYDLIFRGAYLPPNVAMRLNYFGMRGGLKFKFKVVGGMGASIKYLPPSKYSNGPSYTKSYPLLPQPVTTSSLYPNFASGEDFVTGSAYIPGAETFIEMPSTAYNFSDSIYKGNVFELECVIPNMNQNNFVSCNEAWNNTAQNVVNDMGSFIFSIIPVVDAAVPVFIEPYVGFTDETRLGMQTYLFPKYMTVATISTIPTVQVRTGPYFESTTIAANDSGIPAIVGAFAGASQTTGYYYFKP
jgi:hypothetical protein